MYNNNGQYSNSGYQYSQYPQNYNNSYDYYTYPNPQPGPPGEGYPHNSWSSTGYAQQRQPPGQKSEAVVQEMQQQKAQLTKQREEYVRKASVLRHELEQLRNQKQELINDGNSDKDLAKIVKDNDKLQDEIQGKLKAIANVIEMLSSIIKDGKKIHDLEAELNNQPEEAKIDESVKTSKSPVDEGQPDEMSDKGRDKRYNYVYYDSGMHWCRSCDDFPETAKGFLQHLQSKEHQENAKENEVDTTPWHKLPMEAINPSYEDAPKKRIPIKGLQFFIAAPSWYCKLCDVWIGDLHCASHHLKSQAHFQNYQIFIEQNPHWEMEWLKDREKAMVRGGKHDSSDSEQHSKKKKKRKSHKSIESLLMKEKKKKRHSKKKRKQSSDSSSSSSSSDSSSDDENNDRSRSIRVAMRNMSKVQSIMNEDMTKWNVLERLLDEHRRKEQSKNEKPKEDELINQWMTISEPQDKEKHLLDGLKDRMRAKQELEKAKNAEVEKRRQEKEKEEKEMIEKKQKELKQRYEEMENERKRKEQEEYQRIVDKDRNQVKFRAARESLSKENYRKMRSRSRSDEDEGRHAKSPRRRRESEKSNRKSNTRSPSQERRKADDSSTNKKPPGPPSYKRLPFIGRMPLFKYKKSDEKPVEKEIKKEDYEPQRRTRFEPGNLPKAFMPQPDVVCFPKLSSIPPITMPVEPQTVVAPTAPEPPKIVMAKKLRPPPAPKIGLEEPPPPPKNITMDEVNEDNLYSEHGPEMDPNMMGQYYQEYYQAYGYAGQGQEDSGVPLSHTMPLEPPPLPPDDDLAMLGICADDMAAQSF